MTGARCVYPFDTMGYGVREFDLLDQSGYQYASPSIL
jgi:hypothetical protein